MKATMKPAKPFTPIPPGEQIPGLDMVRGFALFGVLLAYTLWNLCSPPEQTYSHLDDFLLCMTASNGWG